MLFCSARCCQDGAFLVYMSLSLWHCLRKSTGIACHDLSPKPCESNSQSNFGHDMGGAKRMGGGKRTRERALPKNSGPLQKSFWSAQSWIFSTGKTEQRHPRGGGGKRTVRGGVQNPFGRGVIREVLLPPRFSTPPIWRVPNLPGANPLVAESAPWRSSQSCMTRDQQPIGNPYRFLSFLLHAWQPNSHSWGRLFQLRGG